VRLRLAPNKNASEITAVTSGRLAVQYTSMPENEGKVWYQKGVVQAAFVAGAFGLALAFLRPQSPPQVVVVQAPPQTAVTPASTKTPPAFTSQANRLKKGEESQSQRGKSAAEALDERPKEATPYHQAASDVGQPRTLDNGAPWLLSPLGTVITATFRETLGSRYVEVLVAPPEEAVVRFPVRNSGASMRFQAGRSFYEVRVLSVDWESSRVDLMVHSVSRD
jgi:hypothetical protein